MAMTRKRLTLIVLGSTLAVLVVGFFSHPYGQQLVFGPRIRGMPLAYWQDRYRQAAAPEYLRNTFTTRALEMVGIRAPTAPELPDGDDMLPVPLSLVDDPGSYVRRMVAHGLNEHPDSPEAHKALVKLLHDDEVVCRVSAAYSLCKLNKQPDDGALQLLRTTSQVDPEVSGGDHNACAEAGTWLILLATERPELLADVAIAFRENPFQRQCVSGMLRELGAAGTPILEELLTDNDPLVRERAAKALGCIGRDAGAAVPALTKAARDPHADVRLWATWALSEIDPERYPQEQEPRP